MIILYNVLLLFRNKECFYSETKNVSIQKQRIGTMIMINYFYDFDWYMYVKIDMYCVCKTEKMSEIWHSEI